MTQMDQINPNQLIKEDKMKTKMLGAGLVAVALGMSAAYGQSAVRLGGQIKLGIDNTRVTGATNPATPSLSATRMTDNTSLYYFSGQEDLGGGLAAIFHLENGFSTATGAASLGFSRIAYVGMQGPWGKVTLGRNSVYFSHYWYKGFDNQGALDAAPLATNALDVLGTINGQYFAGNFFNNTIRYDSADFHGFSGIAAYSFDQQVAGAQGNHVWYLAPTYTSGPLNVGFYHMVRNDFPQAGAAALVGTLSQQADRFAIGYSFDGALAGLRVNLVADRNRVTDNAQVMPALSRTAFAVPIYYTHGLHTVAFTYGRDLSTKQGGQTLSDTGAQMLAASYEYALSKRTQLAVSFAEMKNEANGRYGFWLTGLNGNPLPAAYAGASSKMIYLGIKHVF